MTIVFDEHAFALSVTVSVYEPAELAVVTGNIVEPDTFGDHEYDTPVVVELPIKDALGDEQVKILETDAVTFGVVVF